LRTFLIAVTVLLVIFVAVFRQRIFVRDPLGEVERNDIAEGAARVYINYSNDILVEDAAANKRYLVEGWNRVPGIPKRLACFTGLACWTDATEATVFPLGEAPNQVRAVMSAKEVTFADETGAGIKVKLR
jgi:hypothetical protein